MRDFGKKTCCQFSGILRVNTNARTCVSIAEIWKWGIGSEL